MSAIHVSETDKRRSAKALMRFWIGIISSLIFLWLAMRQISWLEVLETLRAADWRLIFLGSLLMVVTWVLFAVRWQLLLASASNVHWEEAFAYIMIGYLGNAVLPFRLGDVSRTVLLSRKHRINVGFTSATIIVEKIFDILTIVCMAGLLMLLVPLPDLIRNGVQGGAVAAIGALGVMALLARSQRAIEWLEQLLTGRLPQAAVDLFFGILQKFAQGLQIAKSPRQILQVGFFSLLSWMVASMSMWCLVLAFKLSAPWQAAPLVIVVTNLGGAIPSSPGAIGVYEFLAMVALSIWLPDQSTAWGFAAVTHALFLGLNILLGLAFAWREGVNIAKLTPDKMTAPPE